MTLPHVAPQVPGPDHAPRRVDGYLAGKFLFKGLAQIACQSRVTHLGNADLIPLINPVCLSRPFFDR